MPLAHKGALVLVPKDTVESRDQDTVYLEPQEIGN